MPETIATPGAARGDRAGALLSEPKELPAVWLYDERGSLLYEEITRLPEYYLPRREAEILRSHAAEIAERTQARTLVELGAGNAANTRFLLDAIGTLERFAPIDVSEEMLRATARAIAEAYPRIAVDEIVGDFERGLDGLAVPGAAAGRAAGEHDREPLPRAAGGAVRDAGGRARARRTRSCSGSTS